MANTRPARSLSIPSDRPQPRVHSAFPTMGSVLRMLLGSKNADSRGPCGHSKWSARYKVNTPDVDHPSSDTEKMRRTRKHRPRTIYRRICPSSPRCVRRSFRAESETGRNVDDRGNLPRTARRRLDASSLTSPNLCFTGRRR